ncbi:unnamed protein product [Leptosia nina]|uniref:Uncharacterized protein n=1 Tax=Leptosia nina TaxID=320188 RepID=A0AAV1JZC9_9NEOP
MFVQVLVISAAVTAVWAYPATSSQSIEHHIPRSISLRGPLTHYETYPEETYPKYQYTYSVSDTQTGDNKQQQEVRNGDTVKGSYSFHEADGSIRTVEYTADDRNGFRAVVHNTAPTVAPAVIKGPVYFTPARYSQ